MFLKKLIRTCRKLYISSKRKFCRYVLRQKLRPRILILGPGRHGKDTFAEMIVSYTDLRFLSSSLTAAELILPYLQVVFDFKDAQEAFEKRHEERKLWQYLIATFLGGDKLTRMILKKADIYVGMRGLKEYEESTYLFDFVVYVDASERVSFRDSTFNIPYDPNKMIYIDNNSDLVDLAVSAMKFVEQLKQEGFRVG